MERLTDILSIRREMTDYSPNDPGQLTLHFQKIKIRLPTSGHTQKYTIDRLKTYTEFQI